MKKTILITGLIILLILVIWSCGTKEQLQVGKYATEGTINKESYIILYKENKFTFTLNMTSSYLPKGVYSVKDKILTLYVSKNEKYKFKIEGNMLIFQSGEKAEKFIKSGTEFVYRNEE